MVRIRVPYISPRGESPTRRLFQALQPYLTPKRLAPLWSKGKSPFPTPIQNRACEFPSTRLLMWIPSLSKEQGYDPLLYDFNFGSYMLALVFKLAFAIKLLLIAVSISTP